MKIKINTPPTPQEKYMHRCIALAKNGIGKTYPNPMVGAVIVHQGKIIGEGWHAKAGEAHAEVIAIQSVSDQSLLPKSTIYVSLEPCSHFGKTPPCADLIINKKIKNVVIGSIDPHSKVAGRGIEKLRNAGCQVVVGVLESECNDLNKRFFKYHQQNRPYIFLKWAQTKDGFMDIVRSNDSKKESHWISNSVSRQLAHKLRAQEQAILVGCNTVLNDNPKLTCRDWFGENPLRLVIDSKQRISKNHHILSDRQKTVVFNKADNNDLLSEYVGLEKLDFKENIPGQICNYLYDLQIQSVIVEGGLATLQSFIDANLWDEAHVFSGNVIFEKGLNAPELKGAKSHDVYLQGDVLSVFYNDFFKTYT